jgi:hypothetical protein
LQACWRGYITRKKSSKRKQQACAKLAAAEEAARRAPHKRLGARVRAALQELAVHKEPAKVSCCNVQACRQTLLRVRN